MKAKKVIWDLNRFGLFSFKRVLKNETKRNIIINSIPKSGTHLLERLICLLPNYYRPIIPTLTEQNFDKFTSKIYLEPSSHVYISHLTGGQLREIDIVNFHLFLMIRDPRAVLKSRMSYLKREKNHLFRELVGDVDDRLNLFEKCLYGKKGTEFYSINEMFNRFEECFDISHVIKFEDLIGKQGGGDNNLRNKTIFEILNILKVENVSKVFEDVRTKVFSDSSPTFNDPGISKWKYEFSEQELETLELYLQNNSVYKKYYQD